MRKQKLVIISVVSTILLLATIVTSIVLNNQTKATECQHYAFDWEDVGLDNGHMAECIHCKKTIMQPHIYTSKNECVTCGHKCVHSFENGKCKFCQTLIENCEHVSWIRKTDDVDHWEECLGCHKAVFGKEAHTFQNAKCSVCGITCQHKKMQNNICTICGMTKNEIDDSKTCKHSSWTLKTDANYHWYTCDKCSKILFDGKVKHTYSNGKCTECGYTCKHSTYKNNICTACGMTNIESCAHTFVQRTNSTYHWEECSKCGYETQKEEHGIHGRRYEETATCTSGGYQRTICNDCGVVYKEVWIPAMGHNGEYRYDSNYHWKRCTRCNDTYDYEIHNYVNGVCVCGSTKSQSCSHNYVAKYDAGYHWNQCTKCGNVINKVAHTFNTKYNNDKHWQECSCGMKKDELNHKLEYKYNNNKHWQECSCGIKKNEENHKLEYKYNDTKHWQECICGGKTAEVAHKYVNGVCECGKKNAEIVCNHTYIEGKDENYHWKRCTKCGAIKDKVAHTFNTKSNNDKHWQECSCGMKKDEQTHKFETKYNNDKHWHECLCGMKKDEQTHKFETKYNNDKHWEECLCGMKKDEQTHKFETKYNNNKHWEECSCGAKKNEANHKLEYKHNNDKHWQECSCGAKTAEENHVFENDVCTKCGFKKANNTKPDDNNNKPAKPDDNNKPNKPDDNNNSDKPNDNNNTDKPNNNNNSNNNSNNNTNNNTNNNQSNNNTSRNNIPQTGTEENMKIALMIVGAILGAAVLIKLSREDN